MSLLRRWKEKRWDPRKERVKSSESISTISTHAGVVGKSFRVTA